jgi:hypothetical protein
MTRTQLLDNLKWGLTQGMVVAVGFSAFVIIQYFAFGSGVVTHYGLTLPTVILTYVSMGIVGGLIAGLGRPLARTHIGAMAMGVILGAIGYGFFAVTMSGLPNHWRGENWFAVVFCSVIFGVYGGDRYYSKIN